MPPRTPLRVSAILSLILQLAIHSTSSQAEALPSRDFTPLPPSLQAPLSTPVQPSTIRRLTRTALEDVKFVLTSPLQLDLQSGLLVTGAAAAIGGLMAADHDIQKWFQRNRTRTTQDIADAFECMGDGILPLNVALVVAGYLFRGQESGSMLLRTSLVGIEAQALAGGLTYLAKFAVGRKRPEDDPRGQSFEPFQSFGRSFPSQHATQAFAFAAVFSQQYGQPVSFFAYSFATAISLQRIHDNRHFASDVVAGGLLGYAIGKALAKRHKTVDRGLAVLPFVPDAGGVGIAVRYGFR